MQRISAEIVVDCELPSRSVANNADVMLATRDDLVARESNRSRGFGGELLDWLIKQAREHDSENLELDSGVQRFDAHRFYFSKRMSISSYHFRIKIEQKD